MWYNRFFVNASILFNPFALRMAETLWRIGHSECKRVKLHTADNLVNFQFFLCNCRDRFEKYFTNVLICNGILS